MRHEDDSQRQPRRRRATAAMLVLLASAAIATAYHALSRPDAPRDDSGTAAKACAEMLKSVDTGGRHADKPKAKSKRATKARKQSHGRKHKQHKQAPTYTGPHYRNPIDSI